MSKKHKYGNIDHNDLLRYVQGEMSDEDRHALEREIQKDLFVSEALDGLTSQRIEEVRADLDKIEGQINRRVSGRNRAVWIRIAASVAILLTIGTLYFTVFTDIINRTDRMAVETESAEEIREKTDSDKPLPPPEAEDATETEGQVQGEILQEEAVEKKDSEPRTSPAAGMTDKDVEMKSETIGQTEDVLADDVLEEDVLEEDVLAEELLVDEVLLDGKARTEDTVLFMEGEVMADQAEIVVAPENEQEILSEEYAMETTAVQPGVSTSRMARPTSGASAPATSSKKLAGSDPGLADISAVILTDSISTNPVGGMDSFRRYIKENLVFPVEESINAQANVILSFTVGLSGRPGDIELIESTGDAFSREAVRLLQEGPDWASSQEKTRLQIKFNQ